MLNQSDQTSPSPERIIIPSPRFSFGDKVESRQGRKGVVIGRDYNNLLYANAWRYEVVWLDGEHTKHHYCPDLEPVEF